MWRHLILPSLLLLLHTSSFAQTRVDTEIKAENVFELSIIDVFPESYPRVSVVFQAKNREGKPLWQLKKSELRITENGEDCEILSLKNITRNRPLNIALVFDHSGSMVDNPAQMPSGVITMQDLYFGLGVLPDGYIMPIDFAKQGVYSFIRDAHQKEDSVMLVGFSSEVDELTPLTNNLMSIKPYIDAMSPDGLTAFYDAIFEAMNYLKDRTSQPVIVAITDGQDNSSTHTHNEVVKFAQKHNIPIYIIGLGNVDAITLNEMASATDGFFYPTNNPDQLVEIYRNIKRQLKSIYEVEYRSRSDEDTQEERTLHFSFVNDTLSFSNPEFKFQLPPDAVAYLKKKEKERQDQIEQERSDALNQKILWGSLAGASVLLLGLGSFVVYRRRKFILELRNISPNPFADKVLIEYALSEAIADATLHILDLRGQEFAQIPLEITENERLVDATHLPKGVYLFYITGSGKKSVVMKAVKQ